MRDLIGLPKKAHIKGHGWVDLFVENHEVYSYGGLFDWLLGVMFKKAWTDVFPELISQGFRFEAVMKECVKDLKNPTKFAEITDWYYPDPGDMTHRLKKFYHTAEGNRVARDIANKLITCKNWDQLCDFMNLQSDFQKKMADRVIMGELLHG